MTYIDNMTFTHLVVKPKKHYQIMEMLMRLILTTKDNSQKQSKQARLKHEDTK